jgi:hypothetical protein
MARRRDNTVAVAAKALQMMSLRRGIDCFVHGPGQLRSVGHGVEALKDQGELAVDLGLEGSSLASKSWRVSSMAFIVAHCSVIRNLEYPHR